VIDPTHHRTRGNRAAAPPSPPDGTANTLTVDTAVERAMRTIAARGRENTLVDVVHGRVLRQFAAALDRYLVIRIADRDVARIAMRELRATVATAQTEDFVAPPSVRAHLFRLARSIAERHLESAQPDPSARAKLPWSFGASGRDDTEVLHRVRTNFDDGSLELLELRYLRGLSIEEVACVVGVPPSDVSACLDMAVASLERLLVTAGFPAVRFVGVLDDALALDLDEEVSGEPAAPLACGTILGSRYSLVRRVGAGAFGEVYLATDTEVPGHRVALKLLHQPATSDSDRGSALRELHLIASVFHPSIVQFKDHGWHENRLWFVMPWYEGESLESRIRRTALSRSEAHRIFKPLARALATMHTAGIRHQDVKPDNVFLAHIDGGTDGDLLPVLLDLGVAAKEAEMIVAGTPTYFAPEVASQFANVEPRPPIGAKSDVYSLALSLRNALDPALEESIGNGVEIFVAHRATSTPELPKSRDLAYLAPHFERWLANDPDDRPDADTLARELDALLEPETKRARRRAVLSVVVPLAVVAMSLFSATGFVVARELQAKRVEAARIAARARALETELGASHRDEARVGRMLAHAESQLERGRLSRSELEQTVASVHAALDGATDRIDQLRARAELAERTASSDRDSRTRAEADRSREADRAATLSRDLASKHGELLNERAMSADLRSRVASLDSELERARLDVERVQRELSRADNEAATAEARAETIQSRLADATNRIGRLEQDLEAARARARQIEREAERNRTSPSSLPSSSTESTL